MEVAERSTEIHAAIIAVTFAKPPLLHAFQEEMDLPFPVLGDPERTVYRAFGFDRAGFARVWLDPRVWRRYAHLLRSGRRLRATEQDTLQLGGDAVIDRAGRVVWIHRSRGPEDRPTVETVAAAVRDAA